MEFNNGKSEIFVVDNLFGGYVCSHVLHGIVVWQGTVKRPRPMVYALDELKDGNWQVSIFEILKTEDWPGFDKMYHWNTVQFKKGYIYNHKVDLLSRVKAGKDILLYQF